MISLSRHKQKVIIMVLLVLGEHDELVLGLLWLVLGRLRLVLGFVAGFVLGG